jgi:ribosome modulation factor
MRLISVSDTLGVAHKYGYQAFCGMEPTSSNPYKDHERATEWMNGYKEAQKDFNID